MSAIEWTDETWNPVTGCDRVSPGCAHCYALDLAARLKGMGQARYQRDGDPKTSGPGFAVTLHPDKLEEPLRWRRPRMVFVNSMSDLFHEEIPTGFIAGVFAVMADASRHTFQVLTKRPERMAALLRDPDFWMLVRIQACRGIGSWRFGVPHARVEAPLPNVWLGVSIENRRSVDRADVLRDTPAAVRFISAEPLLGPLVFDSDIGMATDRDWPGAEDDEFNGVPEHLRGDPYTPCWEDGADLPELDLAGIDWLIVGGESGAKRRPMREEWVYDLRDAALGTQYMCSACAGSGQRCLNNEYHEQTCPDCGGRGRGGGTAFFFKQHGGRTPKAGGRELDGRTWDEFPAAREVTHV